MLLREFAANMRLSSIINKRINHDDEKTITVRFRIELEGGVYIIVDRVFNIDDYNNIINLYGVIDVDNLFNYMMYGAEVEIDTGIDVEENYTIMTEEEVEEEIESFLDVLLLEIKDEILKPKTNDLGR